MWIQVRPMDGRNAVKVDGLSKLTKVELLREKLQTLLDVTPDRQRLFYRGKQMEDGHTLFDYNVNRNDIVQIIIRSEEVLPIVAEDAEKGGDHEKSDGTSSGYESSSSNNDVVDDKVPKSECSSPSKESVASDTSPNDEEVQRTRYYKIGDAIDAKDGETGSWFEAKIAKITRPVVIDEISMDVDDDKSSSAAQDPQPSTSSDTQCSEVNVEGADKEFTFHVVYDGFEDDDLAKLTFKEIRPRAHAKVKFDDLRIGQNVMANYNMEVPKDPGYWYDVCITSINDSRANKEITGTLFVGSSGMLLCNSKITHIGEIFKIEAPIPLDERTDDVDYLMQQCPPPKRMNKPQCSFCKDNPQRKCKHCACSVCGGKDEPKKQIICDECDDAFHIWCLDPPLGEIPSDNEWFCPRCKVDSSEVVRCGEKLKESKKKAKLASAVTSSSRDWGKGMACVGRTKMCKIVPPNHFGPIPGIDVGTLWKFRVQVSEAGIHRPHVAGIHGRDQDGAFSIVLSGGYEDDMDDGDQFTYTGSGGRDLSGNKRTAEQSSDQQLTRMNKALAMNCNAPLNKTKGAEAKDWKGGKAVRVVRNFKGKNHSKYSPEQGNRYDGLYKVVKYWPEKGKSGHLVWRYMLRRDDPSPAPWSKEGKRRIQELGLKMQFPEGYLDENGNEPTKDKAATPETKNGKKAAAKKEEGGKRKRQSDDGAAKPPPKKKARTQLDPGLTKLIEQDEQNSRLWEECMESLGEGMQTFVTKVEELFMCICCQDLVYKPVTTDCKHNLCHECLSRSFKAEVYSCPACRQELGKNYSMATNKVLRKILQQLLKGYENGR